MRPFEAILDMQIATLKANGRLAVAWGIGTLTLGVVATAALYGLPGTRDLADVAKLGPSLLSAAISSLQVRPFQIAAERRSLLLGLRSAMAGMEALRVSEQERLLELLTDTLKESGRR